MSSSRFLAKTASFIKAEQAAVSRFFVRHPTLSRFIAHIPGASQFLLLPTVATLPHVAPVYNALTRRPRRPVFRL